MDASIRLDEAFLLGHSRVSAESVPVEVWQAAFDSITRGDAGKHLMFLKGSKPLKDHLNNDRRQVGVDSVEWPQETGALCEAIRPTVHCFEVARPPIGEPIAFVEGVGIERYIYLTTHGTLLLWEATLRPYGLRAKTCVGGKVSILDRDRMRAYWTRYGREVFLSLYNLITKDIDMRDRAQADARRLLEPVQSVITRVG